MSNDNALNQRTLDILNSAPYSKYSGQQPPLNYSMPSYVSKLFGQAYNQSTYGLAQQLITGEEAYDLRGFEGGPLFDVASGVLSIVMDLPTFAAGGVVAKQGVKGLVKAVGKKNMQQGINQATKVLAQNNARPETLNRINKQLTETFITKGDRLIESAGGLGLISGVHDVMIQEINDEDISITQSVNASLLAASSLGLAKFTGVAAANVINKQAPKIVKRAAEFGGEVIGFQQPYTFAQGNLLPSPQDLAHTAGTIGGVKILAGGINKFNSNLNKKIKEIDNRFTDENRPMKQGEKAVFERLEIDRKQSQLQNSEIYYSKENVPVEVVSYSKSGKSVFFKELGQDNKKRLSVEKFRKQYIDIEKKVVDERVFKTPEKAYEAIIQMGVKDFGIKPQKPVAEMTAVEKYNMAEKVNTFKLKENLERDVKALGFEKKVDFGVFDKLNTFTSETLPRFFGTDVNIFRSPKGIIERPARSEKEANVRGLAKAANRELDRYGEEYSKYFNLFTRPVRAHQEQMKSLSIKEKEQVGKAITNALETKDYAAMSPTEKVYREGLNLMGGEAKRLNALDADWVNKYSPRMPKESIKVELYNIVTKALYEKPVLRDAIKNVSDNPDAVKFLKNYIEKTIKTHPDTGVRQYFNNLKQENPKDYYKMFMSAQQDVATITTKSFHNIQKQRTSTIKWDPSKKEYTSAIFETNGAVNYMNYAEMMARQLATRKVFGNQYEKIGKLIEDVERSGDLYSAHALARKLVRQTGQIELDPAKNYPPAVKKRIQDFQNFIVATKIGGGVGVIYNLTQLGISSHFVAPYSIGIPAFNKYFNAETKKSMAEKGIQTDNAKTLEVLTGRAPIGTKSDKITDFILEKVQFNPINRFNFSMSAHTGIRIADYLNDIARGSIKVPKDFIGGFGDKAPKAWAKEKLYNDFGLVYNGRKLTAGQQTKAAMTFGRDSQLQRNYNTEPLFMSEPRIRPFLVFKSFPIKQAQFISKNIKRDLAYGNVAPVLRLMINAQLGGFAVIKAIDMLQNLLSGNTDYDYADANDFADRLGAVGAFGIMGDIIAAEDKTRAAKFILDPVMVSTADDIMNGVGRIINDLDNFGMTGALKRAPNQVGSIFGSNTKQLLRRLETANQEDSRLNSQKRYINKQVIELYYNGREEKAKQIIANWNRNNPDYPILEPSIEDIFEFVARLQEKRQNP